MKFFRTSISLFMLLSVMSPLHAAPITFNTALPVHESGLLLREQAIWIRKHNDPSPLDRKMDVWSIPSVLVYGATSKLALIGVFPYLNKELKIVSTGIERKASGLGDIATMARYQVFQHSRKGQTMRGAIFAGLKWPTGKDDDTDSLGLLPRSVQLGSGSYDPIVGTVWTGQWLAFQIDYDLLFRRNNRADGFKFGDLLQEDISLQYRIWPRSLESQGVPTYFYGVIEANSIYRSKNTAGGVKDNDSGGYQLFLTPGIQMVTKRVILEFAAQLPTIQNLNGNALETDFNLLGSFRVWF